MYKCELCGYSTKYKSNLIKHQNKKNPCLVDIDIDMSYKCKYCNITFGNRNSKYKHQKKCSKKTVDKQIEELKEVYTKTQQHMMNEIDNLKTLLEKKEQNINIENMNIEIVINNFGDENTKYISNNYLTKLLELPLGAIKKLVKQIHFNKFHPENHNIKITNKKLPYISLFSNNKWIIEDKKEVLENIVDNGYTIIDEHYLESGDNLTQKQRERYKNFQTNYENGDKYLKKKLLKDVELTILNNNFIK